MKKFKNLAVFALSAVMALSMGAFLAACGDSDSSTETSTGATSSTDTTDTSDDSSESGVELKDYSGYTSDDWLAEDFDSKTISYQFIGEDQDQYTPILLNLYSDGGVYAEHLSAYTYYSGMGGNFYYGTWSEEEDEDGNVITIEIVGSYGFLMSTYAVGYYDRSTLGETYELYEESDGGYTLSMSIDLILGKYTRSAVLSGSTTVTYDSISAFEEANPVSTDEEEDSTSEDSETSEEDSTSEE